MTNEEIKLIKSKHNAAIIAPAGHGKTEMITELVEKLPGKKLVLTHTNAGISVLTERFNKYSVSKEKFCLQTISSFCMKWCYAYPRTGYIDKSISLSDKRFHYSQYIGAAKIFSHQWARDILLSTFDYVIVDEYQDCIVEQHQIFLNINKAVPIYVFGDPLQSIFGWAGQPVSWKSIGFEVIPIKTEPHRWANTNIRLGQYLSSIRTVLEPSLNGNKVCFPTVSYSTFIKRVTPSEAYDSVFINNISHFKSTLYIAKWPKTQCSFSQNTGGLFQNDEPQNLEELYTDAELLDIDDGFSKAKTLFSFIEKCATHIGSELSSYKKKIEKGNFDFSRISKYPEFGKKISDLYKNKGYEDMLSVLEWIKANKVFRLYRKELFFELMRSIRFARDKGITIFEASQQIRMIPQNQSKYSGFRKLSSRVVLSKGLEFECVVINLNEKYTATEMYVAMTRATKEIYFITDKDSIMLDVPLGL